MSKVKTIEEMVNMFKPEESIKNMTFEEKRDYLFRFMFLTLGYYGATKNYKDGRLTDNGVQLGPLGFTDQGEQATEALDLVKTDINLLKLIYDDHIIKRDFSHL